MGFFAGGCVNLVVLYTMPEKGYLIGSSGRALDGCCLDDVVFLLIAENPGGRFLKVLGVSLILFIPDTFKTEVLFKSFYWLYPWCFLCLPLLCYFSRKFAVKQKW